MLYNYHIHFFQAERPNKKDSGQTQTTRVVRRTQQLEDSQTNFHVMDEIGMNADRSKFL